MEAIYQQQISEIEQCLENTGSTIPAQRACFRKGYSFSNTPIALQLPFWDYVWKTANNKRLQMQAFFFVDAAIKKTAHIDAIWQTTRTWQELVNCWDLCDGLSKIYTKALEVNPDEVYKQLTNWNQHTSLWMRRQSVVSLLYYSRTKKVHLPYHAITALIVPLLQDNEYYVQKGVGWAIRELHTVYPESALPLITKHINDISPIAFTTTIEKMSEQEKAELKQIRNLPKGSKK